MKNKNVRGTIVVITVIAFLGPAPECSGSMQQQQSSEASFKGESRATPVNYLIDRGGKIAAAWLGYDQNST
jgi:hypothetical protein